MLFYTHLSPGDTEERLTTQCLILPLKQPGLNSLIGKQDGQRGPISLGVQGREAGEQVQGRRPSIWLSTDKIRNQGVLCGTTPWQAFTESRRLESEVPRKQTKGIIKQRLQTAHTLSLKCNLIFGSLKSERLRRRGSFRSSCLIESQSSLPSARGRSLYTSNTLTGNEAL